MTLQRIYQGCSQWGRSVAVPISVGILTVHSYCEQHDQQVTGSPSLSCRAARPGRLAPSVVLPGMCKMDEKLITAFPSVMASYDFYLKNYRNKPLKKNGWRTAACICWGLYSIQRMQCYKRQCKKKNFYDANSKAARDHYTGAVRGSQSVRREQPINHVHSVSAQLDDTVKGIYCHPWFSAFLLWELRWMRAQRLLVQHSLEKLPKCVLWCVAEMRVGLSGQTAAWLNIIIVMQQRVSFSDQEMRVTVPESNRSGPGSCGSRPTEASQHREEIPIQLDFFLPDHLHTADVLPGIKSLLVYAHCQPLETVFWAFSDCYKVFLQCFFLCDTYITRRPTSYESIFQFKAHPSLFLTLPYIYCSRSLYWHRFVRTIINIWKERKGRQRLMTGEIIKNGRTERL